VTLGIRLASGADAAALARFAAECFAVAFGADNAPEDLDRHLAASYSPELQAREILDPDWTTLLVEDDAVLAGFAQLREGPAPPAVTGPRQLEVARFYIGARWHGGGVAQRLMAATIAAASARGAETLWLGVWERNPRAIRFYARGGFVDVGEKRFAVGSDIQRDRVMVRTLSPRQETDMTGHLLQLSIKPRTRGERGLPKRAVPQMEIARTGAAGDYNHYRATSLDGDPDQAILLMTRELLDQLNQEGWPVAPGDFGENITLGGVPESALQPGVKVMIGPVVLVVTKPCDPCRELYTLPYIGPERGAAFLRATHGRRGWYARVVTPGTIDLGAPVRLQQELRTAEQA
jgi:MOSC domain-containing protein YiiM/ribosomal protein S18 acetylase RimI-like enzyme